MRTIEGDPSVVLQAANKLHPTLQLTVEKINENGNYFLKNLNN